MNANLLKKFIKEQFPPFSQCVKMGLFTKEMKGDYEAQSKRICDFFGYESVFEYGAETVSCHLSMAEPEMFVNEKGELHQEPFITVFKSIYE